MDADIYQVTYSGQVVSGADKQEVRNRLKTLFKATDQVVDKLMSGKKMIIKKGITETKAQAFQQVMHKAGAIAQISLMVVEDDIDLAPPPKLNRKLPQNRKRNVW